MKQIHYSGSSKLISKIVYLLNRKAPLPLNGDGDPSWGTNGQVLSTDGTGNTAWVNQGGGGDVTDVEVNGTSVVNAQGVAEVSVPTKTSDLNNDSDFVSDASYVHTDENFTSAEKTKLGGIAAGAEVNVQADWNEADSTSDAYIANKPSIPAAQIQSDWTQSDNTQADYIKNKPTIPTVNDGTLTIQQNGTTVGTFSANQSGNTTVNLTGGGGSTYTEGDGIDISAQNVISVDTVFTEASTRTNIASGDTLATIWGKIKKFFTDLATVAFSGKSSDLNNDAGFITSSGSCASATKATQDADGYDIRNKYVNIYNSANIGQSSSVTVNDLANQGSAVGMIYAATDNPYGSAGWVHVWSQAWTKGANTSWVSQIALGAANGTGMWYRTHSGTAVGRAWKRVIDSDNIGSQSVAVAAKLGRSGNTSYPMTFNWSGQSGQPSWLWGGSDGTNMYVYNPSNFSVNYASSAGSASSATSASKLLWSNGVQLCGPNSNNAELRSASNRHLLAQDDGNLVWYGPNNNVIWQSGQSSRQFKHNIQDMTEERAKKILNIRPVTFDWNDGQPISTQKCDNAGVIAEEVSQIYPDLVVYDNYEHDPNTRIERRVEYERFTPYLIKMVQIQQKQIDTMQATINALEQRLSKLEGK